MESGGRSPGGRPTPLGEACMHAAQLDEEALFNAARKIDDTFTPGCL